MVEDNLVIGYYDVVIGSWVMLNSTSYPPLDKVIAYTKQLSTFTIMEGFPPSAVELSGIAMSESSINWSWNDANSGDYQETEYRIYTSTAGLLVTLSSNTVNWTETGLNPNTQYNRYVRTYNF
ncbi:unnamed protein product, partial [marine sediment metagenome]